MFVRHMSNIGRTYILSFHLSVHRQRFSPLVWPRFSKIRYVMKNAVFTFLLIRTDANLLNSDRWTKDTNLVMPGFLGTPAGMTTISAPTRESSSCSAPTNPTVSALDWIPVFISRYYDAPDLWYSASFLGQILLTSRGPSVVEVLQIETGVT